MEKEGYYAAVGAFVLMAIILLIGFISIIAGSKKVVETQRYEIQFSGSVSGLDEGSEVRYLGVKVGRVYQIGLVPDRPRLVSVMVDIKKDVPIYTSTVAQLRLQGITGISYVELAQEGTQHIPVDIPPEEDKYPRIKARDSELEQLFQALPLLVDDLGEFIVRANEVLSDENIHHVRNVMQSLDTASGQLSGTLKSLETAMNEVSISARELRPDMVDTLKSMNEATENLVRITELTQVLYEHNKAQVNSLMSNDLQEIAALIEESKMMVVEIRKLAEKLERDPSQVIYRQQQGGMEVAQ